MYYDLKNRQLAVTIPTGLCGQISPERLLDVLRSSGEFQEGETVTNFSVNLDNGMIIYRVENRS